MASTGDYVYLCMTGNGWGTGPTEAKAIQACRDHMGSTQINKYGYVTYQIHPDFEISEVDGTIYTPKGHPPIMVTNKSNKP